MKCGWWLALAMLAGCAPVGASPDDDPPRQPPAAPRVEHLDLVRYHMRRHFGDLAIIQRQLIAGHLDEARLLAFSLAKPVSDPGLAPWASESRDLVEAARALAAAQTTDDALRRVTQIAAACATCHVQSRGKPIFARPDPPPRDDGTPAARMALHQWGVDRLWEGVVATEDERWRSGLAVLGSTPLPLASHRDAPRLADRFQARVRTALARRAVDSIDDRAIVYGELLVICSQCHMTRTTR